MTAVRQRVPHPCSAVGCFQLVAAHKFMCEDHTRLIPQANREELMRTFEDWKKRLRPRGYYVAARIRTIVAVAQAQSRTPPASLTEILRLLDSGEWRPRG